VADEVRSANPEFLVDVQTQGNLDGDWDSERVEQLLSNLLTNAVQHGAEKNVGLSVKGEEDLVLLEVHNEGPPIRKELLGTMFDWHMTCGSHCTDLGALNEQPRERALASEKHVVQPLTWTKTMRLIRDAFRALIAQGCASQQETKPSSKPRLPLK